MKDNTKVFEEYTVPKAVMTMALPSMLSEPRYIVLS